MSTTPPIPTTVEPGQIWRDNDPRSKGAGEFEVVEVGHHLSWHGQFTLAKVRRESGRHSAIRVDRLLNHTGRKSGYTYIGRAR